MNKLQKIMYFSLITSVLASCSQNVVNNEQSTTTTTPTNSPEWNLTSATWTSSASGDTLTQNNWIKKELKIASNCVGCGHCVRFAVNNFKMNYSTHKAEVISQDNINWNDVANAISRCPVDAISIG